MSKYLDGWHKLAGQHVYIEGGKIRRAVKQDYNGFEVPAAVYRWSKSNNCWCQERPISVAAYNAGMRRGTIDVK